MEKGAAGRGTRRDPGDRRRDQSAVSFPLNVHVHIRLLMLYLGRDLLPESESSRCEGLWDARLLGRGFRWVVLCLRSLRGE